MRVFHTCDDPQYELVECQLTISAQAHHVELVLKEAVGMERFVSHDRILARILNWSLRHLKINLNKVKSLNLEL